MPPPDPKSRTTSPGFNSASAVGLPQPSEARTAASGSCPTCPASYRFPVIGSQQDTPEGDDPQQAVPAPLATRRAASPYFCFTTSVILDRKSTRLNSSHPSISYAVFCLNKIK